MYDSNLPDFKLFPNFELLQLWLGMSDYEALANLIRV